MASPDNVLEIHSNESSTRASTYDTLVGKYGNETLKCCSTVTQTAPIGFNIPEENNVILKHVAMQLEYYFSKQNLSRDTYVQTLRDLNDGCVPIFILANFAKIKAIVLSSMFTGDDPCVDAIINAVKKRYTHLLELNHVNSMTGKIIPNSEVEAFSGEKVLVVGPVARQPLELNPSGLFLSSRNLDSIPQNSYTLILRDVPALVTENEVLALFHDIADCPQITGITKDIAHCWFVTLSVDSREIMMNIMMQLRSMTLGGEYVMARLKASNSSFNVYYSTLHADPVEPYQRLSFSHSVKKKKKIRPKKNRCKKGIASHAVATTAEGSPICLSIENFPSLHAERKIEWEMPSVGRTESVKTANDDCQSVASSESPKSVKPVSDGASTATTMSSSVESILVPNKVVEVGGYAAAVMKPLGSRIESKGSIPLYSCEKMSRPREFEGAIETLDQSKTPRDTGKDSLPERLSFADVVRQMRVDRTSRLL